MQVIGTTTEQYIMVASYERQFKINEILVILDRHHKLPKGEVVETYSMNRFIPEMTGREALVDREALEALKAVGWDPEDETVHVAKLRILDDLTFPVEVGATVRLPEFHEVKGLLVKRKPDKGLVLGVIRGTEEVAKDGMDEDLQNVAYLFDKETGILPQGGVPFIFDHQSMDQYPHIGVFGGSGSGKSFGLRVLLEEIMKKKFPVIVFDPHFEMDFTEPFPNIPESYRDDFSKRSVILTVGSDVGVKFEDLEPEDLVSLLEGIGNVTEPQRNAVITLHKKKDSFQTFFDRVRNLLTALEDTKELDRLRRLKEEGKIDWVDRERLTQYEKLIEEFGQKVGHSSSLRSISWKLNRLDSEGVFAHNIEPIVEGLLSRKLVVVRGSVWLLKVVSAFAVRQCYYKRRNYRDAKQKGESAEKFPPFAVVTDEAHNFAPKELSSASKTILKEIAQEGRKYGVFLVFATQRPALLDETITAQLNTKLVFRTVRSHDIEVLKQETDISKEEAARLPYLPSGTAYISSAIIGRSMSIKIRVSKTTSPHAENPFEEIETMFEGDQRKLKDAVYKRLPLADYNLTPWLEDIRNEVGMPLTQEQIVEKLLQWSESGEIVKKKTPFGTQFELIKS